MKQQHFAPLLIMWAVNMLAYTVAYFWEGICWQPQPNPLFLLLAPLWFFGLFKFATRLFGKPWRAALLFVGLYFLPLLISPFYGSEILSLTGTMLFYPSSLLEFNLRGEVGYLNTGIAVVVFGLLPLSFFLLSFWAGDKLRPKQETDKQ